MRSSFPVCLVAMAAFGSISSALRAQVVSSPLDVATLSPEASAVYRTWQRYLASKDGRFSQNSGSPSPDWLESEQRRWPVYDLADYYVPAGALPEILGVDRVQLRGAVEYRITTRFRNSGEQARSAPASTGVTVTTYAVRDGDQWRVANALPRNTCTWRHAIVGTITYVFAPDYPYNAERARQAVAFVDSVASAFQLPGLDSLTYYLAANVGEMYGIIGYESDLKYGAGDVGGLAQPRNRQLFSGSPRIGEDYRHELAHLVLAPLCCDGTSYFVSEGVPTWLGGTAGMDFPAAARSLAAFLTGHPAVSLDSILSGSYPRAQFYAAGAVLTAMVFDRGGVAAVKGLFDAGATRAELAASLERLFGRPWPAIARDWHQRVMASTSP